MFNPNDYQPKLELTTTQAATVAKLNRRTIVAWIRRGNLRATQLPGARGHYRIIWEDLHQVLHKPVQPKGTP